VTPKTAERSAALEAERLAAEAAAAAERAAEARRLADEAAARAEKRRQREIRALRERRLAQFDPDVLEREVRDARVAFERAVLADEPSIGLFIAWQTAATKRYVFATEAETCRQVLEPNAPAIPTGGPSEFDYSTEVQKVIRRAVANKVADLQDELQAELDRAGK
jgi:hypothetical protein